VSVGLRPVSGGQGARPMMPQSPSPPEQKQRRHRLQPRLLGCSASRVVSSPDASSGGGEGMLDRPQGPRAAALARPSGGSASVDETMTFSFPAVRTSISVPCPPFASCHGKRNSRGQTGDDTRHNRVVRRARRNG